MPLRTLEAQTAVAGTMVLEVIITTVDLRHHHLRGHLESHFDHQQEPSLDD